MRWHSKNPKSQKGQVGLEFILIVGAVLVMVIATFPYILKQNELNKGLAAARNGAEFGASIKAMGFVVNDGVETPEGIVKIDRIEYTITDNPSGADNVTISIYVRGPAYLRDGDTGKSIRATIRKEAQRFIGKAMSGDYDDDIPARIGSYYIFAPVNCNLSTWITV